MGISTCKKSNLSMMNRISSMLFIVAAVFFCSTSVSAETFNEGGLFYNVLNDSEVEVAPAPDIFYYVHDVVIPETVTHEGKTYSVTAVGDKAFEGCRYLASVKLGNNITELGKNAFVDCKELTSVKFPKSLLTIGDYAFSGCLKLSDIQFSGNVEYIGENVFNISSYIKIPWLNNQPDGPVYVDKVFLTYKGNCPETVSIKDGTVSIAGRAFSNRTAISTVNLPSSLKIIGNNAFNLAQNLANVNFANVENLEYVGDYAFDGTSWENNIPFGPFYLGKVFLKYQGTTPESYTIKDGTVMIAGNAFNSGISNKKLKSVTIPNSVKYIGEGAFALCTEIKSMVLPEGLKKLDFLVFQFCFSLESVKLPSTLESISLSAFKDCYSLKQIDLPANLRKIEGTRFGGCTSLAKYTVEAGNRYFCVEDGILFSKDKKTLIAFPPGREGDYRVPDFVETIGEGAFYNGKLKSVTIPASVSEIGNSILNTSELLESVIFEPGSNVKNLPMYSFSSCGKLKNLVLPDSLEIIDLFALTDCSALENINFPETLKYIDDWGNDRNKWYENQPDGVVYAGKFAFKIKGSLTDSVLTIKEGTKTINRYFGKDLSIKELVLPESLEYIGKESFTGNPNLAVIKGGENAITGANVFNSTKWDNDLPLTDGVCVFGKNVIYVDWRLNYIEIKEGIENLSLDYNSSIADIYGITKLELPRSLKYIQANSFLNYEVTDTMTVKNIVPVDITKAAIGLGMYDNCVLRVPEKSVDAYRNARGWNVFRNIYGDPDLSGVETVETADNIRVFANGGNIVVEGVEEGTPVEVFNLNGQTVYSGVESLISVPARGIYIVRVEGKAYKVIR